jgi:hypothetical protein
MIYLHSQATEQANDHSRPSRARHAAKHLDKISNVRCFSLDNSFSGHRWLKIRRTRSDFALNRMGGKLQVSQDRRSRAKSAYTATFGTNLSTGAERMGKSLTGFEKLERELIKAERDSLRACMARAALPLGSSRARTTTAVARWWTLAEYRDKLINQYEAAGGDWSALRARISEQ